MWKKFFVFLVLIFSASASFAQTPSLWSVEYGPTAKSARTNSLQATNNNMRVVDFVRPNASALSSKEVAFPIEGISYTFVRDYEIEGIAGNSRLGYVSNSPFLSVITTDKEGRVVVDAWIEQGGRAKNFKVISNTLFEADNVAMGRKMDNDYFPQIGSGKFKIAPLGKRRSVEVCGEPYWLETTAYLYDEDSVNSWLFNGDEAALRVYLQNAAHGINAALHNSKIYDVVVRLVKLEKVPNFPNTPTTPSLVTALAESPYTRSLLDSGVTTVALWFGTYRGDSYAGAAGYNIRVVVIGGGSSTENHESGHNKGANHQPEDESQTVAAEYMYAFANTVETQFSTAVAVPRLCKTFCDRIPVYSTPKVAYNGIATGVADERDNARRIRLGVEERGAVPKCGAGGGVGGGNSLFETKPEE